MKSSILVLLLFSVKCAIGQVAFEGEGVKMDSINTPQGQNYLVLNPHRPEMAFTEERGGGKVGSYVNERSVVVGKEPWKVVIFSDWLGEKGMVSPIGFTKEGMLYSKVSFDKGMYYGEVRVKVGSSDEKVDVPFFRNKSSIQSGCVSKDGRFMLLSMESNDTRGVEDLYVIKKKPDGSWSMAKNLGYQLNSEFQELTPFLAEDNKTLFFATNRPGGQGSFDLYYTIRQDESWRNWSKPINLGKAINTSGAETSFVYQDGAQWAYYISSQDSDGYGDVMKIRFQESIETDTSETDTSRLEPIVSEEIKKAPTTIKLKVIDQATGAPLNSEMIAAGTSTFSVNGIFTVDSLNGMEIELKSSGYLPVILTLDPPLAIGMNEVPLASIAKGNVITLDHVLFHRGTARLVEGSEKELDLVVEVMNDNPNIKILLKGHTDNTGDPVKNVQLSEARVKAVKAYILGQGINSFRVTGKGYGGNAPIASNATEETRRLNRRVEFEVVED